MKFNALIPEFSVSKFEISLDFYTRLLGFKMEYERRENKFAFLSLGSAQIMIEEVNDHWKTAPLDFPFGRGINFQIEVPDIAQILKPLETEGIPLFRQPRDQWYDTDKELTGVLEFLVQDPDGYLLRFCQGLGNKKRS